MITVDLSGPEGNAFYLMGLVGNLCKQLDMELAPILDDMKSDDYDHLLDVIQENFPGLVEFV